MGYGPSASGAAADAVACVCGTPARYRISRVGLAASPFRALRLALCGGRLMCRHQATALAGLDRHLGDRAQAITSLSERPQMLNSFCSEVRIRTRRERAGRVAVVVRTLQSRGPRRQAGDPREAAGVVAERAPGGRTHGVRASESAPRLDAKGSLAGSAF